MLLQRTNVHNLQYLDYGFDLSKSIYSRLSMVKSEKFSSLIKLMSEHKKGIEQEIFEIND